MSKSIVIYMYMYNEAVGNLVSFIKFIPRMATMN